MLTPMPPQARGSGAIPVVLHAQLIGLAARHDLTLVTVAGAEPGEWEAVEELRKSGIPVRAVRRTELSGWARWNRRWQLASAWLFSRVPWRTIWFWEAGVQAILDELLDTQDFDLVTAEDNSMGIYRLPSGFPAVLTEHEVRRPRRVSWQGVWGPNPLRWLFQELDWQRWRGYQHQTWSKYQRLQVFSDRDAAVIAQLAPELSERVRVNPFGIDLPEAVDPSQGRDSDLIFVGNFSHFPNVDAAVWIGREIMPRLLERCPGVRLNLVGIYPPKEVLSLAGDAIHVLGAVPQVEPFLRRATLVLAPMRIGGGMRMKVLQAMALGKAVITTPRGAEGLAVDGQEPPLLIASKAEELADAAGRLLENHAEREELGERARAYVRAHFSPEEYRRRLEAVYREAIGAGGDRGTCPEKRNL